MPSAAAAAAAAGIADVVTLHTNYDDQPSDGCRQAGKTCKASCCCYCQCCRSFGRSSGLSLLGVCAQSVGGWVHFGARNVVNFLKF